MHQTNQQAYADIVRFLQAYRDNPGASDDVLLRTTELRASQLNQALDSWSVGLDMQQLKHYLGRQYIRQQFAAGLDAMYTSNPAGNARSVKLQVLTRAEYWQQADGMCLRYGIVDTPFGNALLGFTERGLCHLTLHDACDDPEAVLRPRWAVDQFASDQAAAASYAQRLFGGQQPAGNMPAWIYGSDFQLRVWQALMQLPSGKLLNYQQLAALVDAPRAARAVGTAMAKNRLSWLIPCHRVLRQSGEFGEYGGGAERKMAMVAYEAHQI